MNGIERCRKSAFEKKLMKLYFIFADKGRKSNNYQVQNRASKTSSRNYTIVNTSSSSANSSSNYSGHNMMRRNGDIEAEESAEERANRLLENDQAAQVCDDDGDGDSSSCAADDGREHLIRFIDPNNDNSTHSNVRKFM